MTHCAKCGAELIGTRKFCTACGAPAGDPRSPAASTGQQADKRGSQPSISQPAPNVGASIQYAPMPASDVNPFAQTAGPNSLPMLAGPAASVSSGPATRPDYGPPPAVPLELATTTPGVGDPSKGPQVSPLAISNIDSQRGGMVDQMVASAKAERAGSAPPPAPGGIPGTQLMPSVPNPGFAPAAPSPAGQVVQAKKRAPGTQLMAAPPPMARSGSNPEIGKPPSTPGTAPLPASAPAIATAAPVAQPPASAWNPAPAPVPAPPAPVHAPPAPIPAPAAPAAPYPYPAPPPPMAAPLPYGGYGYGGLVPGSRVSVTWANGHRYPGTVQQITGSQCLVVFPDGQLHWVDMQYVSPG